MVAGPIRVYADTSVFGGVFDEEFERGSKAFFEQVRERRFQLVISDLNRIEIGEAPSQVRQLFEEFPPGSETGSVGERAIDLRDAYLDSGVVGNNSRTDALHVAIATVSCCEAIVSWNFRHIVHLGKISMYNEIDRVNGYNEIGIHTPLEVIEYED